jgi:hypothetical protein
MPAVRVVVAAVLLAMLLVVPAARASFPSSIETTVVPGGNAAITSPTLDPAIRSATVDVAPASPADDQFFENMQVVLSLQPTPGKRLLMCIGLYINVAHGIDESVELQFPEQVHPLAVLLLSACLEQAAQLDRAARQARLGATSAVQRCNKLATQVDATFTRVGRRYKATIDGTATKLKQRGRLKVTCAAKGAGLTMKVRPVAKGVSLRSVVGPRLRVGAYNPLESSGSGRLKVTFRR